ncbi:hypothetical protein [Actinophytocola oryzae]|nr:hypothetical protein [Actinophytocola oryzae]
MLGTGIASADEDVNPDAPPSTLDGAVPVPVHFGQSAAGTVADSQTVLEDAMLTPSDLTAPTTSDARDQAAPIDFSGNGIAVDGNTARDDDNNHYLSANGHQLTVAGDPTDATRLANDAFGAATSGDFGSRGDGLLTGATMNGTSIGLDSLFADPLATVGNATSMLTKTAHKVSQTPVAQPFEFFDSGVGGLTDVKQAAVDALDSKVGGIMSGRADGVVGRGDDLLGDSGAFSGTLVDVPVGPVTQPVATTLPAPLTNGTSADSLTALLPSTHALTDSALFDVPGALLAQSMTQSFTNTVAQPVEGESNINLPNTGILAPTTIPTITPGARSVSDMPARGGFGGVLSGFPGSVARPLVQTAVQDVSGIVNKQVLAPKPSRTSAALPLFGGAGLPANVFGVVSQVTGPQGVPVTTPNVGQVVSSLPLVNSSGVGGQRDLPVHTPDLGELVSSLPLVNSGGLGGQRDLPVHTPDLGELVSSLPLVNSGGLGGQRDLPVHTPDLGELVSSLPLVNSGGLGGQRDLPLPTPNLSQLVSSLPLISSGTVGLGRQERSLPSHASYGNSTDVTNAFPVLPAEVTTLLPAIPAVDAIPVAANLPIGHRSNPRGEVSTLDSTRAALANLFTSNPVG